MAFTSKLVPGICYLLTQMAFTSKLVPGMCYLLTHVSIPSQSIPLLLSFVAGSVWKKNKIFQYIVYLRKTRSCFQEFLLCWDQPHEGSKQTNNNFHCKQTTIGNKQMIIWTAILVLYWCCQSNTYPSKLCSFSNGRPVKPYMSKKILKKERNCDFAFFNS